MIRDVRRADSPYLFDLMTREFPEESALLGNRPEGFQRIIRRVWRWDTRLILGLARLVGRRLFRFLVVEADGRLVAMTMVTFPQVSAYVSNVVVDPAYRRRGFAKRMLEEARRTAKGARRKYIALDVLENNTRARTLYEGLGYRSLRTKTHYVRESTHEFGTTPPANPAIRRLCRGDTPALLEIVRRQTPPAVEEILPTAPSRFAVSGFENRMLGSEQAAWVIDRGHGAEAHLSATVSVVFEAAHVSPPVLSESVDPALADALVRTAGAWVAAHKAPRILSQLSDDNVRGRAALEAAGFTRALGSSTLYRTVD
ncbi:MAG: GNAT family N-acetyltransferase [Thermoplasmata archaeon]